MNWQKFAQINMARAGLQQWLDEHAAATARGDRSGTTRAALLVREYEQYIESMQRQVAWVAANEDNCLSTHESKAVPA